MKLYYIICITFLFVFILGCTSTVEQSNPIEGTWELISGKYLAPDTTYLFPVTDYHRHILMINRTYYVWIRQDTSRQEANGYGGGKYTVEGDNYTEHIEFFFTPNCIGKSVTFTMKVKGDTLVQTGTWPAKRFGIGLYDLELYEVYKRID